MIFFERTTVILVYKLHKNVCFAELFLPFST